MTQAPATPVVVERVYVGSPGAQPAASQAEVPPLLHVFLRGKLPRG